MKINRIARAAAVLASTLALGAVAATLDEAMSHDGLEKIRVKDLDYAYARPGASLAEYSKVLLEPVEVAFHKDWNPTRPGSRLKVSSTDRDKIRTGVAAIVLDEFMKELQAKGTYPIVNASGPDVLRVKARIVNLYVNAPDTGSTGRTYSYSVSAGEMTLFLELYDSETGQILARVIDRAQARDAGIMWLSTSTVNRGEAQDIAASWARTLRNALDKAHDIGKK